MARGGRATRRRRYRRHQTPTVRLLAEVRQLVDDVRDRDQPPHRAVTSVATQTSWTPEPGPPRPPRILPTPHEYMRHIAHLLPRGCVPTQIVVAPEHYEPHERMAFYQGVAVSYPAPYFFARILLSQPSVGGFIVVGYAPTPSEGALRALHNLPPVPPAPQAPLPADELP
ncbi:MAG TPA: hypothetical protein VLS45_08055, partial [Methylomicrobium sp.]|nr:hypothetical protein [Methylomicrobium sp.]